MHLYLAGNVLSTVVVVSVLILTALLGLLMLWQQETLLFAHSCRLRQARADVESAYTLYRLHPKSKELTASEGLLLYDTLPQSRVVIDVKPWGLYDAVLIRTADSLLHHCRLFGANSDPEQTLFYADNRSAITLAGKTVLRGRLKMPHNGIIYGRVGADFYRGVNIPKTMIGQSEASLPQPRENIANRITALFSKADLNSEILPLPASLTASFIRDSSLRLQLGNAEICDCSLSGPIILYADELRIDSTCRIEHLLICARKIILGRGGRVTAQLFASDTVIVEPRSVLAHPSGIFAGQYAEIGDGVKIDGYVIVRDTVRRKKMTANYQQSRTARVRGLVWTDGVAQIQGIIAGRAILRQAVYFSQQGYYKDMLYDVTLLENPHTIQPLWLSARQRKEVVCVH